jgi:hypothetical protein
VRLAVLGEGLLAAVHRWPQLAAGLYARVFEQTDRLSAQLAICQLPRVDQRVLSLLWLLAESWGHVGPAGTVLPVSLTHDMLGTLIGARRPTVTLALGELSDRGAIVRQERGWLLLEQPPAVISALESRNDDPELFPYQETGWRTDLHARSHESPYEDLARTIDALREEHARSREKMADQLSAMRTTRERCTEVRRRIAGTRPTRRAPSSGSSRAGRPG